MAKHIEPAMIARVMKDRRAIGPESAPQAATEEGYTLAGHCIQFAGFALLGVFWLVLAYLWTANLQPSLPIVPAACGLLGLLCAGRAGWHFSAFDGE